MALLGGTLSQIAADKGLKLSDLQALNPNADLNTTYTVGELKLPDTSPTSNVQDIPGIGTLTTIPKIITPAPTVTPDQNLGGLYTRTGVTPPTPLTVTPPQSTNGNNRYQKSGTDVIDTNTGQKIDQATFQNLGLNFDHLNTYNPATTPTVPSFNEAPAKSAIKNAYDTMVSEIDKLTQDLTSSKTASPEEQQLAQELAAKKAELAKFDTETLSRVESYAGQGRGQTQNFVALNQDKERKTRALERLGLAQDESNLVDLLNLSQDQRKQQGDIASLQYDLATKRLDLALGVQKELQNLDQTTQDNARKFLLDVIDFSQGKTWDQLDQQTQAQLIAATANSPITLGMVKTALQNGVTPPKLAPINTLTIAEADKLGLPRTLVGKSESQVLQDLQSPTPPPWFKTMAEEQAQANFTPDYLMQLWKQFQATANSKATSATTTTKSTSSGSTDYGAFNLPAPVQ